MSKPSPIPPQLVPPPTKTAVWFSRAVWLGILSDWLLGVPGIFFPQGLLSLTAQRATLDPAWTSAAACSLFVLSLFYIPGASSPHRYKWSAWLAVLARPPGVVFFLIYRPGFYPLFGVMDGVLFVIQFLLLLRVMAEIRVGTVEPLRKGAEESPGKGGWFRVAMGSGIAVNLFVGVQLLIDPESILVRLGVRNTYDVVWTSFAALLFLLTTLFYLPVLWRPLVYRYNSWLAVWARLFGVVVFLFIVPNDYQIFALFEGVIFLIQLPLVVRLMQDNPEYGVPLDTDTWSYQGSSFNAVKTAAWSGNYDRPPFEKLPYNVGLTPMRLAKFFNDSRRNMSDKRDVLPYFDKLIHSNGICYSGVWKITEDNPYTGCFKPGTEALAVARASVAGPWIWQGLPRAFGIGLKLFLTRNPDEVVEVGNIVTVDKLSGSWSHCMSKIAPTNNAEVGWGLAGNLINRVLFRLMDTRPGYRQLYPVSRIGLAPGEKAVTPDEIRLAVAPGTPEIDAWDFRNEMRLESYPSRKLVYTVQVRDFGEEWKQIGTVTFDDYVISQGGDKRLHFWIPRDVPTVHDGGQVTSLARSAAGR